MGRCPPVKVVMLSGSIKIARYDCFSFIKRASLSFDFVFADPPFDMKNISQIPGLVRQSGIVRKQGIFVLEHGEEMTLSKEQGFVESRKFGHVTFSFFNFEL